MLYQLRLSTLLAALLLCFLSASSDKPKKAVEWTTETTYNFGEVELGSVSGVVFSYKNTSDQPVLLQTVRTTCGCTAAKWPESPVPPGGTGDIRIEFAAENSGGFSKKIRVFFDAMRKPEILRIEGVVR
jgi:hypothetical protein